MVLVDEEMKSGRAGLVKLVVKKLRSSWDSTDVPWSSGKGLSGACPDRKRRVQSTLHCLRSIAAAAGPRRKPGRSPNRRAQHEV